MATVQHRTCHLCEAMCGLTIKVENDRVTHVAGDKDDPFSRGHICPKGAAIAELHDDPDRLRHPMRRNGSDWEEISWEEALDQAAAGITRVQKAHGKDAFGFYVGNPTVHSFPALTMGPALLRGIRSKHRFSATSVDQLPHMVAAHQMFGHQLFLPIPDIDRCDYMLMLGANPMVSNGSIMSVPDFRARFREVTKRGETVVVDPRRTETAKEASRHLFIRPGTDAFFLLALVREVLNLGHKLGRLAPFVDGLDDLQDWVAPFTPERSTAVTGIAAEEVSAIAKALVTNERALVYGRMGTCTQEFGGLSAWLLVVLNIVSGNLDRPGGVMFTTPATPVLELSGRGHLGRWRSSVRDLPEFGGELPVSALAEEAEAGNIRGMMTLAGNPVLSTPDGKRLDAALAKMDFMVSVDPYLNETTRHANLILPPCSPLERPHYDLVFNALAVRNVANYSPPLFETDAPHDGNIIIGILRRVCEQRHGRLHPTTLKVRALEHTPVERLLDIGLRLGPYGAGVAGFKPRRIGKRELGPKGKLSLRYLKDHPHGVDLGPLTPAFPDRAPTGRIQIAPELYGQDLARLTQEESKVGTGMRLIGRRQLRSNNSWMHNLPSLMKGRARCTLLMHPTDAERLGLSTGDEAKIETDVGAAQVPVQVSDEIMPGVVSLPHGFGHRRKGTRLRVAEEHAGVSLNDLTNPALIDALTGNAVLNGVPVRVESAQG